MISVQGALASIPFATDADGALALVIIACMVIVPIGMLVWYLWAMSRLFPLIGLKSGDGWIPVWNNWKLLERTGLPGWVVLLAFVPGLQIVTLVFMIIAMNRIGTEKGAGVGYTVLGVFISPLWAMLLANHIRSTGQAGGYGAAQQAGNGYAPQGFQPQQGAAPQQAAAPGYGAQPPQFGVPGPVPPAAPVAPQPAAPAAPQPAGVAPVSAFAPAAPSVAPPAAVAPAVPSVAPPAAPVAPPAAPAPAPAAPADQPLFAPPAPPQSAVPPFPGVPAPVPAPAPAQVPLPPLPPAPAASVFAPPAPPAEAVAPVPQPVPAQPAPVELIDPLAPAAPAVPAVAPAVPAVAPAVPAVAPAVPAVAPAVPAVAPAVPAVAPAAPAVAPAVPAAAPVVPPVEAAHEAVAPDTGEADDDLDRTLVVPRARERWTLELPDGEQVELSRDAIVGRRPEAQDGADGIALTDPTRTLSKEHARLRFDGSVWTVEDLGSTNGVFLIEDDGAEREIAAGAVEAVTDEMLFGQLRVKLRRGGDAA